MLNKSHLRAVHARSVSGKMGRGTLDGSQATQSGSSKGELRLLHCNCEIKECN